MFVLAFIFQIYNFLLTYRKKVKIYTGMLVFFAVAMDRRMLV